MTAIVDYGVGNLFSLRSSFDAIGVEAVVTSDPAVIEAAERVLWDVVKNEAAKGKPLLGICLGMQMLLEKSYEFGEYEGLGLIPGSVVPLEGYVPAGLKIPQMGWNALEFKNASGIFKNTKEGEYVYFVHSYYCDCPEEYVTAVTDYGASVTASVRRDNVRELVDDLRKVTASADVRPGDVVYRASYGGREAVVTACAEIPR